MTRSFREAHCLLSLLVGLGLCLQDGQVALAQEPKERASLRGHTNEVQAIAISPDGRTLVSGSNDKTLKLWDLATGKERATFRGHSTFVEVVAISPDGKTIASSGRGNQIKLWDIATGMEQTTLDGHPWRVRSLAFSPDGMTLASGSDDQTVKLWDMKTRKERSSLSGHGGAVMGMAFTPDGHRLAAGSNSGTIKLWHMASGKELANLSQHDNVDSVAFSPDSKTLAAGGNYRGIRLWEVTTGMERASLVGRTPRVISLALAANGKTLAAGGHGPIVELWDITTGKALATLKGDADFVHSVAFTPDGKTLAAAESPDTTIRLWDVSTLMQGTTVQASRLSDKKLLELWADLAGADGAKAYQAIWALIAAAPQAVPWLKEHLQPTAPGEPRRIAQLILDLNHNRFAAREEASRELEKLGESARPALHKALTDRPGPEMRRRLESLLEKLDQPARSPERLRALRAIEVLEQIGNAEARRELEQLATGMPEARVTQEAKASLARLVKRGM